LESRRGLLRPSAEGHTVEFGSGDNDGLDKIELMKTYQLLGGGVSADLSPMPKSHLAIVPSQGHVSLMMQTKTILDYLNDFLK
jgi:hypothetical protein